MNPPISSNIYVQKLNGFRSSHRNKWHLLYKQVISLQAMLLLEFYLDIFDFDQRHFTYQTFQVNYSQIAEIFHCSVNTVRNWHNELLKCGLIHKTHERNKFVIPNCERYLNSGTITSRNYQKAEYRQFFEQIFQFMCGKLQPTEQSFQPVGSDGMGSLKSQPPIAIISSKFESKFDPIAEGFTEDDKAWIEEELGRGK